ncbi:hypothetical protein [Spinactinospora alkalitolerans]|uniref:hypothetical protein n=1 Tax=Spinactinospora alkalitolerans TaxID=687207 RepID=UPI0031D4F2D8
MFEAPRLDIGFDEDRGELRTAVIPLPETAAAKPLVGPMVGRFSMPSGPCRTSSAGPSSSQGKPLRRPGHDH